MVSATDATTVMLSRTAEVIRRNLPSGPGRMVRSRSPAHAVEPRKACLVDSCRAVTDGRRVMRPTARSRTIVLIVGLAAFITMGLAAGVTVERHSRHGAT